MAVTVQQLYEGIRAGVGAPTGVLLTDVTRILAYANEAVRQYAADAPESVKDMAVLQIGQYLYDAPVAARRSPANVLSESGAWAMLAPYREHRAVVLGDVAAAAERGGVGGGLSREEILALIAPWAQVDSTERIPAENLPAAGSLTLAQVRRAVLDDPEIVGFREFEQSLRHTTTLAPAVRVQIDTPFTGVALQGASNWPVATVDREFTVTVGDSTSPEIDYSVLEAAGHVVSVGSFLSTSNAVGFTLEGVQFFIGRTATRQIVFTSGTFGTYTVTVTDSVIDLKDAARLSGPPLPSGGAGVDTAAVDVRIRALVSPTALRASILRWASNRLALATEAAEGAVELATTIEMNEGNLTRVPTAARVKAFVEAQADSLSYARTSKRTEVFGAFTGAGWEVSDDVTEAGLHTTLLTTANPTISGLVLDIKGSFEVGVRYSNRFLLIRLAKTEARGDWRLNIEGRSPIPLASTTAGLLSVTSTSTTYDFYTYSVGDYPADSTFAIEHFVPFELDPTKVANTPAVWAIRGNTQAIPEAKLGDIVHPAIRELNNLPIGLAVTSTSAVAASRLTAFTNDLDLDDDPNGDIIVVATASTTTGSAFGIVASTDSDSNRETMNAFASEVSALPDHNFRQPTVQPCALVASTSSTSTMRSSALVGCTLAMTPIMQWAILLPTDPCPVIPVPTPVRYRSTSGRCSFARRLPRPPP